MPVDREFSVATSLPHADALTRAAEALSDAGFRVTHEPNRVHGQQGSQVRTRLFGGWFVKGRHLPKRIEVWDDGHEIGVRMSDTLGVGLRDPKLRRRYDEAFDELRADLETRLGRVD